MPRGYAPMPGISQKRFHSTIQGPSAQTLEILAPRSEEIMATWTTAVREIGLSPEDFTGGVRFDFGAFAVLLRRETFASFRKLLKKYLDGLAARGVTMNGAIAALNRLFEISVSYVAASVPAQTTAPLALARLHALIALLSVGNYTGHAGQESNHKALEEASLTEADERVHGASAYVTKIYERERRRLSHDLHDEVGHDLILIKLYLEMISIATKNRELPEIQPRLNEAITLVSHAIDSVRRLVLDLGPAVFDELGFLPAVKSYANQFSARTRIKVTVQEGYVPDNVPQTHQVALYRLMQGALSNVLKHASAKNVKVSLGSMKDSVLIMVIEDDGIGFDTDVKPGPRSFGLTAMRERVEVLGGRFHVESKRASALSQKHGTRIEVDLPLPGGEER
jgi:signal transduction histidine kinase